MPQFWIAISTWLHTLATVVLVGYYVLLSLVYLPVFSQHLDGQTFGTVLGSVSGKVRLWIFAAIGIFIITGIYLMLIDTNYLGFANFGNTWAVAITVKHLLVLVMIGLGVYQDRAIVRRLADPSTAAADRPAMLGRLKLTTNVASLCGVVILLLTAVAQGL
jgi:uncharacterized membrane protein